MNFFEFLTPPTWPKVQLIAIQRPKSLKDYFLESRFMATCKNSANSNGGVSRNRRGVFILNTYRSTPYLERRADGAPTPVLPETGCTSSGHLVIRCFPARQVFGRLRAGLFLFPALFISKIIWQRPSGTATTWYPPAINSNLNLSFFETILFSKVLQPHLMNWASACFWGTRHTCPSWNKLINLKFYKFKNLFFI